MTVLILVALALALANGAFERPVITPDWNWSLCVIGVAGALHFARIRNDSVPRLDRLTTWLVSGLLGIAALQVIPLPTALVALLSPARVELLRATSVALGPVPAFATLSIVPAKTIQYLLYIAGYTLVFLIVRSMLLRFQGRGDPWIACRPLIVIAALEALLGLYQVYSGGSYSANGTYVNRDHYSALLEMCLPFAVLYPVAVLRRRAKLHEAPAAPAIRASLILFAATLILLGIVVSLSRMGFVATMSSLFVILMIIVTLSMPSDRSQAPSAVRRFVPPILVGLVILIGLIYLPTDPLIERFSQLSHEDISTDTRTELWRESLSVVRAFPLFGSGLGGYESAFLRYKVVAPMNTADYAHNDYLQFLIELGGIGFAIGLALAIRILYAGLRGVIYARSTDEYYLSVACVGSLTAILLHSWVDFNIAVFADAMTVCWVAGIASVNLVPAAIRPRPRPESPGKTQLSRDRDMPARARV